MGHRTLTSVTSFAVSLRADRRRFTWCRLPLLAALLTCTGCASTQLAPVDRADFQPETDERELWDQAKHLNAALVARHLVYEDEQLQRYVDGVTKRLLPHVGSEQLPVRVRVLKDPFLNAFALPDGTVYVHSGMLARMENEAQLATVLGHELTHFTNRHSLKALRSARNSRTAADVVIAILAVAAVGASGNANAAHAMADLGDALSKPVLAAQVSGYSRDLEREADARGFAVMVAAGYDAREAPKFFTLLREETREGGIEEPYFFGNHPRLAERIANYDDQLAEWKVPPDSPRVGAEAFADATSELLLDNAQLDLDLSRSERARRAIERHLAHRPGSPRGFFMLGELHRRTGEGEQALAAYERAEELDAAFAGPHRERGMLYRALGRSAEARAEFERYMALAPNAADRPIISAYAEEMIAAEQQQ